MAYDRFDTREERSRWSEDRNLDRDRGRGWSREGSSDRGRSDDRGFFDRAGDEIASWFGDDEAERRRREDHLRDEREGGWSGRDQGREWNRDRSERDRSDNRAGQSLRSEPRSGGDERDRFRERGRDYRPMTGDYGRSERFLAGGMGPRDRGWSDNDRSESPWARDEYRSTSRAGTSDWSDRSRHEDPHYRSWRERQMSELDRDYDDYRRENQSRFESDFGNWRERRQQKRSMLSLIREHMEVVGNDDEHIGTVDRIARDRVILAKSDPESGGAHHSLSCSDIDRVEGDRVILDCSADQARSRWRDETRGRALFERDDQGEMGARMLDRSFEGTYR